MPTVSFFSSCHDREPTQVDLTWTELCDALLESAQTPADRADKTNVPAMTICSYQTGRWRGKDNVEQVFAAAIDVDDGRVSMSEMTERLTDLGLAAIVHSTTKLTLTANRYRVILPLATPVAGADYPALFSSLEQAFDGLADKACRDASRLSIMPHHWTGDPIPEDQAHRAITILEGVDLDVARLAKRFPVIVEIEPQVMVTIQTDQHDPDIADFDRSPIVTERMVSEYLTAQAGGRLFRFMVQAATRALYRGLVIDASIIASLGQDMDRRGPDSHRRLKLMHEARNAIKAAHKFVAAHPPEPKESREQQLAKEMARLKARRK